MYEVEHTKRELAETAIYIERVLLNESGGIQDEIWAAYGNLSSIQIEKSGFFNVRPLPVSETFTEEFLASSVLFCVNVGRQSYEIAKSHDNIDATQTKLNILSLAEEMYQAFSNENIPRLGELLDDSWRQKKKISPLISNPEIDGAYDRALSAGAYGGKLLGTGGGGFLYMVCDINRRDQVISAVNLPHLEVGIDTLGSRVIFKE